MMMSTGLRVELLFARYDLRVGDVVDELCDARFADGAFFSLLPSLERW